VRILVEQMGTHESGIMKAFKNFLTGVLLVTGLIVGLCFLHAQEAVTPIQARLAPAFDFTTDSLWLQIDGLSNGLAYLTLYGTTDQVYAVMSKTDLTLTNWNIEQELWPTFNQTPFTVPVLDRTNALFIWAADWTGVTENGNATPDWWFWKYFGTLDLSDTNLDSKGNTLLYDYQHRLDPNVINFSSLFTNIYVTSSVARGTITVLGGTPSYVAVLVNHTSPADADWQPWTSTNVTVNLDSGDGLYDIWIGLRGLAPDARQTWQNNQLILDTVPPLLILTNPATGVVFQPMIQLQGYANEALSSLTYDISSATGILTNRSGCLTGQSESTNFFDCPGVALASGTNIITLHASDLAGNTTDISLTLNCTNDANPPVLTVVWPQDGTQIGGSDFALQAQVNDPMATVSASVNGNTVPGIVEANGKVWVNDLPLDSGTNLVTVTAINAVGSSTAELSVVKSPVAVSMDPLSTNQLNQPFVAVTGTIDSSGYDVWVNGIQAMVNDDGTWEADGVPVSESGTTSFDMEVYSSDQNNTPATSQIFNQPQPVTVAMMSYFRQGQIYWYTYTGCSWFAGNSYYGRVNSVINWYYTCGGTDVGSEYGLNGDRQYYNNRWTNPLSVGDTANASWQYVEMNLNEQNSDTCGNYSLLKGPLHVRTRVMIVPAGQTPRGGGTSVYLVNACTMEATNLENLGTLYDEGGVPLPPEWVAINGQTLANTGVTNDDGSTWGETVVSGPVGWPVEVTPVATHVHRYWDYTFDVHANEVGLQLGVDADRDGNITFDATDATSVDNPYRFWVNNDYDGYDSNIGDYADLDPSTGSDANNLAISCTRDLEDYTRLWINTQGITEKLRDGTFRLALEWKDVTDDPKIQFFQAVEADGGALYLTDTGTAQLQFANSGTHIIEFNHINVLTQNNPFIFPPSFWTEANVSTNQPVAHLLFDAVSRGSGKLVISIYKTDGMAKLAESQPIYLKLQDVKEMYERWTVGDGNGGAPATTATVSMRLPSGVTTPFRYHTFSPEENEYILFVHGWNLAPWERDAFADTAFKRLYWQGYKGRFGAFQWPTEYGFGSWKTVATDPDNYDNSELNAWSSATGLLDLLNNLNIDYPSHVYMFAHSMGNIVAGEALKRAGSNQVVNTYIAMQSAVPAHCYDQIADFRTVRWFLESGTPDRYANYPTNNGPCYFNGIAGAGSFINFYNANDWALAANHWQLDQDLKPDTGYGYVQNEDYFFKGFYNTELNFPADTYEIFAYCDEARCYAIGAQANVGGAFLPDQEIDLNASPYNFGSEHNGHSAQFNSDNVDRYLFWEQLLVSMNIKHRP